MSRSSRSVAIQVGHRALVPNSLDTVGAYFSSLKAGVELWHGGFSSGIPNGLHLRAAKALKENTLIEGVAVNPKYLIPLAHSQVVYGRNEKSKRCSLLGPAAFVNHSCQSCANAKLCTGHVPDRIEVRRIRLIKEVAKHEQIFCYYGDGLPASFRCMVCAGAKTPAALV
tara:strand:- start:106 stop:612 length:507 start_codon:yes stop_codon:yes gene_type:complete